MLLWRHVVLSHDAMQWLVWLRDVRSCDAMFMLVWRHVVLSRDAMKCVSLKWYICQSTLHSCCSFLRLAMGKIFWHILRRSRSIPILIQILLICNEYLFSSEKNPQIPQRNFRHQIRINALINWQIYILYGWTNINSVTIGHTTAITSRQFYGYCLISISPVLSYNFNNS